MPPSHETIPDEHLEFIERLLFYEFDEAYSKQQDGYYNQAEVLAYERALETITEIRELLSNRSDTRIEDTADEVFESLDDVNHLTGV